MKNILVTGANGQLGSTLRAVVADCEDCNFVFTDIAELDITDVQAVGRAVEDNAVDLIINCAAYTAVDRAESDELLATRLNAEAPRLLAEAVAKRDGEIIHVSTDYVFSGEAHSPYTEDDDPCPQTVYGRTKLEGERAVAAANPKHIIVRTAWLYSPYGNNFVKTMLRLGRERDSLGVVYDQIGTPTYAADLAAAILKIAVAPNKTYGVFHYSNEGVASWYDFTKSIHRLAGICSCRVSPLLTADYPTPAHRPAYSVLHKGKIREAYGVDIPYWEDSLGECIRILEAQK